MNLNERQDAAHGRRDARATLFLFRRSLRRGAFFLDGCLGGGEAGDGDAVGGATDVGEADAVAELDAVRIAAVFAADAEFDVRAGGAAFGDGGLHELADAGLVERRERVL